MEEPKNPKPKLMELQVPSRPELLYTLQHITEKESSNVRRDRALISMLYLTGSRISELLVLKKWQISKQNIQGKDFLVLEKMTVLKRRTEKVMRTVLIPIEREKDLCKIVVEYINTVPPEDLVFKMTRQRAWQIVSKLTGQFNHFFRHSRVTHLITIYGFNAQELKKFFGWASSKMADSYSHLDITDLARKLK